MKTDLCYVLDNDGYYSKYPTDSMRTHSNLSFYFGTEAAQNATNSLHVSVYQIKWNAKGKTC